MDQLPSQPIGGGTMLPPTAPIKKFGALIKIISVVVILAVASSTTLLATRIWDPAWSPFRPSPEKVIALMSEKMQAVKSSHSEIKIDIDMKSPNPGKVTINISSDSDINNLEEVKAEADFKISLTGQMSGGITENASARAKIKMIGQEGYFNISEFNAPSLGIIFIMMGIDLNNLIGSWIKFPIESQPTQDAQGVGLTDRTQKIISDSKVYIVKKQLPDQTIEGQKMYHYSVALDNEKTAKLIGDLAAEVMKQSSSDQPGQEMSAVLAVGATKGMILEFLDKVGEISAELLIGKNDNLLYGLKMEKNIDLSKIDKKMGGVYDISFETANSRFGQSLEIKAPEIFKTFEEVIPPQIYNLPLK